MSPTRHACDTCLEILKDGVQKPEWKAEYEYHLLLDHSENLGRGMAKKEESEVRATGDSGLCDGA